MQDDSLLDCLPFDEVDFRRGRNCELWDSSGKRYLDLESGSWAAILGHCNPGVDGILRRQAGELVHLNVRFPNHSAVEAARSLRSVAGLEDGAVVFLSSGSEAVEFGAEALRKILGRPYLLCLSRSYLSACGSTGRKSPSEWLKFDWEGALEGEGLEAAMDSLPWESIGGVVFETGGGSPDFLRFPPREVVAGLATRARACGGRVMFNEVTTGMGRTGSWFSYEAYGIRPDLVAVGKGLGNGYPVSAAVLSRDLASLWSLRGLHHAQSHQGNPLACAVAAAVIAELADGGWVEKGAGLGARFLERMRLLPDPHGRVADVRGRGMLMAIEFRKDSGLTGEFARSFLWKRGIIASAYPSAFPLGTGLRFDPALTLPGIMADEALACLEELLALPEGELPPPRGAEEGGRQQVPRRRS
jgi:acetylornithine aminotransferase